MNLEPQLHVKLPTVLMHEPPFLHIVLIADASHKSWTEMHIVIHVVSYNANLSVQLFVLCSALQEKN